MTPTFLILFIVLCLLPGCRCPDLSRTPPDMGHGHPPPREAALLRAQDWLVANQNRDGSWGSGEHAVLLTSLATLAFLSRGETPASKPYGVCIDHALRFLIREAGRPDKQPPRDRRAEASLIWCLSEAYSITRIPVLQATLLQSPRLTRDDPVPWRVLAAKALFVSQADARFTNQSFLNLCPPVDFQATNGFDRVVASLICRESGRWKEARTLAPPLESTNDWKRSDTPFMHANLLQGAFFDTGGKSFLAWNNTFYPSVIKAQKVRWNRGWWTPEALGLGPNSETAGMSKADAALYATAWMILCEPPTRHLPTYHDTPAETVPAEEADDIKIEIL